MGFLNVRFWTASFLVLLGVAEFYQWVKDFTLPLPIYVFGGAFLALASNYEKGIALLNPPQSVSVSFPVGSTEVKPVPPSQKISQPPKPISFKIKQD